LAQSSFDADPATLSIIRG